MGKIDTVRPQKDASEDHNIISDTFQPKNF